jgi:peptidyl-prolyl cis-trans isomerase SDCCAG10
MSLEPQTSAKVRLKTTKGWLEIELWAKETPITSRIFLQNVLDGKFNGCEFDRIVPNFIVQLGNDPSNESREPDHQFEDEFSSRLKYNKRGLVGSVNLNKRNSNTGKFFITLDEANELNNRNTIFGKVVGDGIFTLLKIADGELLKETPLYPVKILSGEVLLPYFEDLVREEQSEIARVPKVNGKKKTEKKKKPKVKLYLDDGEEESGDVIDIKMKSVHDTIKTKSKDKEQAEEDVKLNKVTISRVTSASDTKPLSNLTPETQNDTNEHVAGSEADPGMDEEYEKIKHSGKAERNLETLNLLKVFESKVTKLVSKKDEQLELPVQSKTEPLRVQELDDYDDDFDNLDGDSGDDMDLYNHRLNFDENPENSKLQSEDLVTIDPSTHKRSRDDFYQNEKVPSVLPPKKSRTT